MIAAEYQLKRKRDEFWDTAPAFEGKVEIWAALKVTEFLLIYRFMANLYGSGSEKGLKS